MKKFFKLLPVVTLLTGLFSVFVSSKDQIKAEAATVETKRVWVHTGYIEWWGNESATTYIYLFASGTDNAWPGQQMKRDSNNKKDGHNLWYFDVPTNYTHMIVVRTSADGKISHNQTVNIPIETYVNNYRYEVWNDKDNENKQKGAWVAFTPADTSIVVEYANSVATYDQVCSPELAQSAIDRYNALSTFEQDQFDKRNVGDGVTGLERLNYLKSFYNINTPLNVKAKTNKSTMKNAGAIVLVGGISLSIIAGYYFLKSRKQ